MNEKQIARIVDTIDPGRVTDIAVALVDIPSPTGSEQPICEAIHAMFDDMGIESMLQEFEPERYNTIGRIHGGGADVSVEPIGGAATPTVLEQAMNALRVGGRLVVVGYDYGQQFPIDPSDMVYRWIEVIGTRRSTRTDLRKVISLVESGRVQPVISTRFPLSDANAAFDQLRRSEGVGRILMV